MAELDLMEEEQEPIRGLDTSGVVPPVEVGIPGLPQPQLNSAVDPRVIAAREARDREIGRANIFQGLSGIGEALGGQGRLHPDNSIFDAGRGAAAARAQETSKDVEQNRKAVADYLKNRAALSNKKDSDEWKQKNFEQRERAIDATIANRDFQNQKPTDAQAQSAGFGKRIQQAEGDLDRVFKQGYDRSSAGAAARAQLPSAVNSSLGQQQQQAEDNFINAVLRRESGAAISSGEYAMADKQYFPRLGDSPEVKEQKKRNREQQLENLKVAAGPAWAKIPLVSENKKKDAPLSADEKARLEELRKKRGQ